VAAFFAFAFALVVFLVALIFALAMAAGGILKWKS
jgi:hypothetical protein